MAFSSSYKNITGVDKAEIRPLATHMELKARKCKECIERRLAVSMRFRVNANN